MKVSDEVKNVPTVKPGAYSDGHPLDTVHYLECKLILKPDRFTSPPTFHEFGKLARRAAEGLGIGFSTEGIKGLRPRIREVIFLDTKDFALYNNAFILRRRVEYQDGFPIADPEVVFKFRHPDLQTAAEMDVRPNILGDYRIKFKAEALPLRDKLGGVRLLYSHNVEFSLRREMQAISLAALADFFPPLSKLGKSAKKVSLVNHTIVEEVLQYLLGLAMPIDPMVIGTGIVLHQRLGRFFIVGQPPQDHAFAVVVALDQRAIIPFTAAAAQRRP